MKDVRGTGKSPKRDVRKTSRKLICLVVSAMALAVTLSPIIVASDSSADTVNDTLHMDLYDANDQILTSPLMENSRLTFNTTTTPEGVIYELEGGVPIDSTPAYFLIRNDGGGGGYSLFKVSVKAYIQDPLDPEHPGSLADTWLQYYGIRVSASDGSTADLNAANSFEMMFRKGGADTAFEMDQRYTITFSTLSGSHILDAEPDMIENITFEFTAEPIAEYHNVEYYSDSTLVETRLLRDFDTIGPFPPVQGRDPIGWIDYEGNILDEDTTVFELPTAMVIALYGWPVIIEKQTEYIDAEGNDVTEKLRKEIYEDGHFFEDTSKKVEDKDGNVKEETSHVEKDSEDNTHEYDTQTDITKHYDGTETHNTSTETRVNGTVTETSDTRTEYDKDKTMVEEEYTLRVKDPSTSEEDVYDVITRLIDTESVEKKYRVEATIQDMDLKDVDKVCEIIDDYFSRYDCEIASVGMKTDTGAIAVPHQMLAIFASKHYRMFSANGSLSVELEEGVVKWLNETGSNIELRISKAAPEDMTEAQRKTVGDNFAISVVLLLDGKVVPNLQNGWAEITAKFDKDSPSVYYVDEDGSSENIECRYDGETLTVKYRVDHFSIFMIVEEKGDYGDVIPFVYITLAELLIIPAVLALIIRRWRRKERLRSI